MEGMTLRPKRLRVLLFMTLPALISFWGLWLLLSWILDKPDESIITPVILSVGWLFFLEGQVDRATISIWDRRLVGPGTERLSIMGVSADKPANLELLRSTWLDRLRGVCWLQTSSLRIKINRLWYDPEDLKQFLRTVESVMSETAA